MLGRVTSACDIIESIKSIVNKKDFDIYCEHVEIEENKSIYIYENYDFGISINTEKIEDIADAVIGFIQGCVNLYKKIPQKTVTSVTRIIYLFCYMNCIVKT